jgi:hypothetical protein
MNRPLVTVATAQPFFDDGSKTLYYVIALRNQLTIDIHESTIVSGANHFAFSFFRTEIPPSLRRLCSEFSTKIT